MNIIQVIQDCKDPRKYTFAGRHQPLLDEVEMARSAVSFMRGIIEDCLHDDSLSEGDFNLMEYIRIVLSENQQDSIDKANYFAREANRILTDGEPSY